MPGIKNAALQMQSSNHIINIPWFLWISVHTCLDATNVEIQFEMLNVPDIFGFLFLSKIICAKQLEVLFSQIIRHSRSSTGIEKWLFLVIFNRTRKEWNSVFIRANTCFYFALSMDSRCSSLLQQNTNFRRESVRLIDAIRWTMTLLWLVSATQKWQNSYKCRDWS